MLEKFVDWWYYVDRRKKIAVLSFVVLFFLVGGVFAVKNAVFSGKASTDTVNPSVFLVSDVSSLQVGSVAGISCRAEDDQGIETVLLKKGEELVCEDPERCNYSYSAEVAGDVLFSCTAFDSAGNVKTSVLVLHVDDLISEAENETISLGASTDSPSADSSSSNHAPQFIYTKWEVSLDEDSNLTLYVNATDEDNDTLSYSVDSPVFDIDNTGKLVYLPLANFFGDVYENISVSDGQEEVTKELIVHVLPVNDLPLVSAGNDRTVKALEIFRLDGSGSSDPENDTLLYEWDLANGVGHSSYSDDNGVYYNVSVPSEGNYIFMLTVYDGKNESYDNITITASGVFSCAENWFCSSWSACQSNNQSTRSCVDMTGCGTENSKPAVLQNCVYNGSSTNSSNGATGNVIGASSLDLGWEFSLAFIILVVIFTSLLVLVMHQHHGKN